MTNDRSVVFVSGVRTAIGTFGGSLKNHEPTALAAAVVKEAVARANVDPATIGSVVFGNVIQTNTRDPYLARVAAIDGGLPIETPAVTVNRLCGSGFQAIVSAAQQILLGDVDTAVAGGAECMSRAAYIVPARRWGQKMGDATMVDTLLGALNDPFGNGHMGITAENIAAKWGIDRNTQDEIAVESHRRAARARDEGRFNEQIMPLEVKRGRDTVVFDKDEHIRDDVTLEGLNGLRPAFKKDGTVTPGNASGINDGAAALVMMDAAAAEKAGIKPLARLVDYAHAAVDPSEMGIGPVPAVKRLLDRTGLSIADMDVIESNEAFAAQACAVAQDLGFPAEKTNPNGGAIALGHPVGATGAILTVKAIYELQRTGGRYGLVTMCIGGGQGIAGIIEAVA
ncbi:MAG: beta-ketothiolase BktB [Rhodospirillaceae bacterium]|jgi:acetyl-CoA C-acetyltransferase|nr:beta-ketothiolase BktB [Rhodospirillaceae bacterium]MBT5566699.1 beta-ketothiolase BktB [Rhodospirillaceae bacterium]MBT6090750.1 beta-ketothiolase BktB [Rhodospirillaceae bacterium]MBT7451282.1 beta-ketothiolase BktB [Rhodospirillaceae bacterium]